jgi:hypothetical protein
VRSSSIFHAQFYVQYAGERTSESDISKGLIAISDGIYQFIISIKRHEKK